MRLHAPGVLRVPKSLPWKGKKRRGDEENEMVKTIDEVVNM